MYHSDSPRSDSRKYNIREFYKNLSACSDVGLETAQNEMTHLKACLPASHLQVMLIIITESECVLYDVGAETKDIF